MISCILFHLPQCIACPANHSGGDRRFYKRRVYKNSFRFVEVCQEKKGLETYGWCIMPEPYPHDNR